MMTPSDHPIPDDLVKRLAVTALDGTPDHEALFLEAYEHIGRKTLAALAGWADGALIDTSTWTVVETMPTGWDWCATANKPLPNRANVDPCGDDAPLVVLSPRGCE